MKARTILPILLVVGALVAVAGYQILKWAEGPVVSPQEQPPSKIVTIPDGASLQQVASQLKNEKLIRSRTAFIFLARSQSADRKIRAGEYEFNSGMPPAEILNRLLTGQVVQHPITIPEGLTMAQIADLLAERGMGDRTEFVRLARDPAFIASLGLTVSTLEGYLYPDTYKFPQSVKTRDIVVAMVEHYKAVMGQEFRARAQELNMTEHEVLTLASVIEKETGAGAERPEISAVFHNRLKKHIPLQSDPTVIYGLPNFDGNIRKKDLSSPSPYNTYRVQGLPPGPIANPGVQSIKAALYPSNSRALYFVSRNDGTHQFSSTLAEHNQAVERFQKRPFRRKT